MKLTPIFFTISLIANVYLLSQLYSINTTNESITFQKISKNNPTLRTIYQEDCPVEITKNRICSIELVEKRPDFAMIKIHYHYIKGEEGSTRIVVKANKGSHDNTVGTKSAHHLIEGSNTTLIPFGLYNADIHTTNNPYTSEYLVVRAQGITTDGKRYTTPHILETYIKYKKQWYAEGERTSW